MEELSTITNKDNCYLIVFNCLTTNVYIFNPQNDLALASGGINYVAPPFAVQMAHDLAVLPAFMEGLEHPEVSEVVWTKTMAERKERMREDTVAAIALPGGIGTLEELMETHTLRKLNKYQGEVFALNLDGFYNPLKAILDHFVETKMTERADIDLLHFPDTVEQLLAYFE